MSEKNSVRRADTGLDWIGAIPATWRLQPLKHLAEFANGMAFKPSDWKQAGTPIIRIVNLNGGSDFNYYAGTVPSRYNVRRGDILFGWSGNRGTSFGPFVWQREGDHLLNQHIFKVTAKNCSRDWLYWCLKAVTAYVEQEAHGIIGMVHVTKGKLGRINVPVPGEPEQVAIARFLDSETAKIDALIAKQAEFLTLLDEHRRALISEAVTRGLNASALMRESGRPNLGLIASLWNVRRLKEVLLRIEQGWSPQCENRVAEADEWGVLKVGCVNGREFDDNENKALPPTLEPMPNLEVRSGDVLMSRANTVELVGSISLVKEIRPRLMLCDKLYRLKFDQSQVDPRFIVYCLASPVGRQPLEAEATGASPSMKNISQDAVKEVWLAFPPLAEQREIADFLDERYNAHSRMQTAVLQMVSRLRERRAALITAAVTGQIDVIQPALTEAAA